jgi:hypothetical protein
MSLTFRSFIRMPMTDPPDQFITAGRNPYSICIAATVIPGSIFKSALRRGVTIPD